LNTNIVKLACNNPKYKFNYITFNFLKVKDRVIQNYIMVVIQLYILFILPKNLTAKILAVIYHIYTGKEVNIDEILRVLNLKKPLLLGFYFDLYENLEEITNLKSRKGCLNNDLDEFSLLKIEFIIFKIRILDNLEEQLIKNFHDKSINFNKRYQIFLKHFTTDKISLFKLQEFQLKLTLEAITNLTKLAQKLQDYIVSAHNNIK